MTAPTRFSHDRFATMAIAALPTPALVIDERAMQRNIERMAQFAREQGVALRPHVKTHKCVRIARRQMDAGAVGVCTATLGEAEPLLAAGIDDVLITSPAVGAGKVERLVAMRRQSSKLRIVVDNAQNVATLEAAMAAAGLTLDVLVALDIGSRRIGARTMHDAMALAQQVVGSPHLAFAGVHAYAGVLQHIEAHADRVKAAAHAGARLDELLDALRAAAIPCGIVTGAGTGTYEIDGKAGRYTELQVGSYLFMDVEYGQVALTANIASPFEQSLWVFTRVISNNHPGFVTTDAGTKRFAMGGALPVVGEGAPAGAVYGFQGDEHGTISLAAWAERLPAQGPALPLETLVRIRPPHCDPTVNLYDAFFLMQDDMIVDCWPIEGRGAI